MFILETSIGISSANNFVNKKLTPAEIIANLKKGLLNAIKSGDTERQAAIEKKLAQFVESLGGNSGTSSPNQ